MAKEVSKLVQKVEEKSNEVHFTEEEMTKLADLQSKYQSIQDRFGQTKLQKITAQQQMAKMVFWSLPRPSQSSLLRPLWLESFRA